MRLTEKGSKHFRMELQAEQATAGSDASAPPNAGGDRGRMVFEDAVPSAASIGRAATGGAANKNCVGRARSATQRARSVRLGRKWRLGSAGAKWGADQNSRRFRSGRKTRFAEARRARRNAFHKSRSARAIPRRYSKNTRGATVAGNAGNLRLDTLGSSSKTFGGRLRKA